MDGVRGSLSLELDTIAALVQRSALSEADVFDTYRKEIARVGLRGNLSLVDASGENLVMQFAFIPEALEKTFKAVEGITEIQPGGHTFSINEVAAYRDVIETRRARFYPDSAEIIEQILPARLRGMTGTVVAMLGSTAQIVAPLVSDNKVIGTITLGGKEGLSAEDLPAVEAFASHLVTAIENARLFVALQRQLQERELLDRMLAAISRNLELAAVIHTAVESIADVFGYTQVSVYLRKNDQLHLQHQVGYDHVIECIPLEKGISGRVVRTGQPVWLEDVRTEPEFLGAIDGITSEICVPLFHESLVVGILNVESSRDVRLGESDLSLILAISEHINIAIERANLYEEIRRFNAQLEQRVSERTDQLKMALDDLEALSYSISHALRSPLRAIRSYGQILASQHDHGLDDEGRELLQNINLAAGNMSTLVDNLQELMKITRAKMTIEPVDLGQLFKLAFVMLRHLEPHRIVEVNVADGVNVMGDSEQLRLLARHLAENAWKFTSHQPHASIEFGICSPPSDIPVYFLRDNGVGFDMRYADNLFNALHRMHSPDDYPGYGIGLSTAQHVVKRHGGRIWAESQLDKGATFYFTLPG